MKWLRAPNPVDVGIGVVIASAPYWVGWFVTATLPLWSVVAALLLGAGFFLGLSFWRQKRIQRHARELREEERHREILDRLDRLSGT